MKRVRIGFAASTVVAILALAALAPLITSSLGIDPNAVSLAERLQAPGKGHLLGTDELGRDLLARMIHGCRVSATVAVTASILSLIIGTMLGGVAGWFGGSVDWIVSRAIEVLLTFPLIFLLLAISAFLEPSLATLILALGLTTWTAEARLVRAEMMKLRNVEFAQAARASGASSIRIIIRHLLPHAISPALVTSAFGVSGAIVAESALSFLGFGVPIPLASWGSILGGAQPYFVHAWWLAVFPGIAIVMTTVAFNALGETLRDALNPMARQKKREIRRERQIVRVA